VFRHRSDAAPRFRAALMFPPFISTFGSYTESFAKGRV
jgi:hypothetical protein